MKLLGISGSPSQRSRSAWLLAWAHQRLAPQAAHCEVLAVRELPPAELLAGAVEHERLRFALESVARADVLLVSTPIYKAAYSGLLKTFLDLLPQDGLRGKTVLPLATGGSASHLLALDYALKPVLSALGASNILDGVFAADAQLPADGHGGYQPTEDLVRRMDRALEPLIGSASRRPAWKEAA